MQRFFILVFYICAIFQYGCDASAEPGTSDNKAIKFEIVFEDNTLYINKNKIVLPMPIDDLEKQIGSYSRFEEQANDIYTWDNNGFIFWSKYNEKTAYQIGIYIRKSKPLEPDSFSPSGTRFTDSRPRDDFTGTFILDGVKITKILTLEQLNANKKGAKFHRTPFSDQYIYYSELPGTDRYYRVIAYIHQNRTIEYIEISFDPNPWGVPDSSDKPTDPSINEAADGKQ